MGWFILGGITLLVLGLVSFNALGWKNRSPSDNGIALTGKKASSPLHIFDRLPTGQGILFGKASAGKDGAFQHTLDLWFQNIEGQERRIACGVVHAMFSPDGGKLAYATSDDELVIETIDGKPVANLTRARNPDWSVDSASLIFSAIPSGDYPDVQQIMVYHLDSGRITSASGLFVR